jgi:hypothetical protein
MPDITVIMMRPSTSHALEHFKIIEIINEVFEDYDVRKCSSDDDGDFDDDYTQVMTQRTHTVSDSDTGK